MAKKKIDPNDKYERDAQDADVEDQSGWMGTRDKTERQIKTALLATWLGLFPRHIEDAIDTAIAKAEEER